MQGNMIPTTKAAVGSFGTIDDVSLVLTWTVKGWLEMFGKEYLYGLLATWLAALYYLVKQTIINSVSQLLCCTSLLLSQVPLKIDPSCRWNSPGPEIASLLKTPSKYSPLMKRRVPFPSFRSSLKFPTLFGWIPSNFVQYSSISSKFSKSRFSSNLCGY